MTAVTIAAEPAKFSLQYFDSLPNKKALEEAQAFVGRKFPPGSDVQYALKEFADAGAECLKGQDTRRRGFYGCYHEKSGRGFPSMFVKLEWKVIICLDPTSFRVDLVKIGRGFTGL